LLFEFEFKVTFSLMYFYNFPISLRFKNTATIESYSNSSCNFVTFKKYEKRESDVIYKIQLRGQTAYIVILIEFQSSVDKFMALRILRYISSFYMRLKDSDSED